MIRFLKAKLRVMQEEMDRMNTEAKEKVSVGGWVDGYVFRCCTIPPAL